MNFFILSIINTFEFSGYIGVPLRLNSRRFLCPYMYPINYSSGIYWVHICTINKRKNCLYIYFLNAIFIDVLIYLSYFFTSIERASDSESNDMKIK